MSTDESDPESHVTTDPDRVRSWANDCRAVPVREDDRLTFVDEGKFDADRHYRIDWDDFETALNESDRVVVYHEDRDHDQLEIRHRDQTVSHLDDETIDERLGKGHVISQPTEEIGTESSTENETTTPTQNETTSPTERETTTTTEHEAMTPERVTPTDDDEGKTVVDTEGAELGIVTEVEGDQIYVDPRPTLTEQVMSKLGWEDADDEDYVLGPDEITLITDEAVEVHTPK